MFDYDIKKVKKTSKSSKTDYFKNANKHKQKKNKKKNKSNNSFWDVPQQYTTKDNSNLNYNYLDLEKKLKVDVKNWGVDSVSSQILTLIKDHYLKYESNNQNSSSLIHSFLPLAKEALKQGYDKAEDILPPLDQDIEKLLIATYSKSIEKLQDWAANKKNDTKESTKNEDYNLDKLIIKISNLFIEQGIYLEEQKLHHPLINTKR
mgnify:CR=1 FL=1